MGGQYTNTRKKQHPVSIPKIKPWQKQPKIIQKQIWKFSGPLYFCLISLPCSKYSLRSCRNTPHISFFNEKPLPVAFRKAKERICKIEFIRHAALSITNSKGEGSRGFLCRNKTLFMQTAWKVSKYGFFSAPYFLLFSPNTEKYGPEKTPYLDIFYAVVSFKSGSIWPINSSKLRIPFFINHICHLN